MIIDFGFTDFSLSNQHPEHRIGEVVFLFLFVVSFEAKRAGNVSVPLLAHDFKVVNNSIGNELKT